MRAVGPGESHDDVDAAQIEALRRMGSARRAALMGSLSAFAIDLSRRAIRRANPSMTEEERKLTFISLHYGSDLAARVGEHLRKRRG